MPIYTHPNPYWRSITHISDDGRYLMLQCMHNSNNDAQFIADLKAVGKIQFKTIVSDLSADHQVKECLFFHFKSITLIKSNCSMWQITAHNLYIEPIEMQQIIV